jgi:UDP-glucose 4-epimerase
VNVFNVATDDYIIVNEIAEIVTEEMKLSKVVFEHTGGSRGWKGDVPVVRFNIEKIHTLGWKSKYNSKQAIRLSIQELLKEL